MKPPDSIIDDWGSERSECDSMDSFRKYQREREERNSNNKPEAETDKPGEIPQAGPNLIEEEKPGKHRRRKSSTARVEVSPDRAPVEPIQADNGKQSRKDSFVECKEDLSPVASYLADRFKDLKLKVKRAETKEADFNMDLFTDENEDDDEESVVISKLYCDGSIQPVEKSVTQDHESGFKKRADKKQEEDSLQVLSLHIPQNSPKKYREKRFCSETNPLRPQETQKSTFWMAPPSDNLSSTFAKGEISINEGPKPPVQIRTQSSCSVQGQPKSSIQDQAEDLNQEDIDFTGLNKNSMEGLLEECLADKKHLQEMMKKVDLKIASLQRSLGLSRKGSKVNPTLSIKVDSPPKISSIQTETAEAQTEKTNPTNPNSSLLNRESLKSQPNRSKNTQFLHPISSGPLQNQGGPTSSTSQKSYKEAGQLSQVSQQGDRRTNKHRRIIVHQGQIKNNSGVSGNLGNLGNAGEVKDLRESQRTVNRGHHNRASGQDSSNIINKNLNKSLSKSQISNSHCILEESLVVNKASRAKSKTSHRSPVNSFRIGDFFHKQASKGQKRAVSEDRPFNFDLSQGLSVGGGYSSFCSKDPLSLVFNQGDKSSQLAASNVVKPKSTRRKPFHRILKRTRTAVPESFIID